MKHDGRVVYGGVDTHQDVHVAAVIDDVGMLLGTKSFPTTPLGLKGLQRWLVKHGQVAKVGVEGTGTYGLGLQRVLQGAGIEVVEVKEYAWALGVPGKPDIPCEDYETWARKYEEMADKVTKAGNATPETRLKKLQELRNANQVMFSRLQPEQSLVHTKALVKRRAELGAE